MEITCTSCQRRFKVAREKLPKGKTAIIKCPKCKGKITVEAPKKDADETLALSDFGFVESDEKEPQKSVPSGSGSAAVFNGLAQNHYDAAEKPFDFIEEEGKTALICETDPSTRSMIVETLKYMEYHISVAENVREALKQMRYHNYDLIVVNEEFDANNGVLIYLERLNMDIRRDMFVVILSRRNRTMDDMTAFQSSANLIVNLENMIDFGKILKRALTDYEFFYRIFREVGAEMGFM